MLLDYIVHASEPVDLGTLAELLGIEKSSTHRLLATLVKRSFIIQNDSKKYVPGPAILQLASRVSKSIEIDEIVIPNLRKLAEKCEETIDMGILRHRYLVLTHCIASSHALAVRDRTGQIEPLHSTALGKALLCFFNEKQIRSAIGGNTLKKYTSQTITTISQLTKECAKVKKKLLAEDNEEYRAGIRCLATPLRDFSGDVVAAIGISAPASRFHDERLKQLSEILIDAGLEISRQLGFCPES